MKLFGLHDKDGNGFVIEWPNNNLPTAFDKDWEYSFGNLKISPITKPDPELQLQLQVGQWYVRSEIIYRIRAIHGKDVFYDCSFCAGEGNFVLGSMFSLESRSATHEEIETHLINEANAKGLVRGCKFKSTISDHGRVREMQPFYEGRDIQLRYIDDKDALYCDNGLKANDILCSNPDLYRRGVWVEVITKSKELPKNPRELFKLIHDYVLTQDKHSIKTFLEERGYELNKP